MVARSDQNSDADNSESLAVIQFIRDLALLPAIWRRAIKAERYRRWVETPEGWAHENQEIIDALHRLGHPTRHAGQCYDSSNGAAA